MRRAPRLNLSSLVPALVLASTALACGPTGGGKGGAQGDGGAVDGGLADGGGSDGGAADGSEVAPPVGTLVTTTSGSVLGRDEGDLIVFKGIPYAKAPEGDLRFRAPEPPDPWSEPREALAFAPPCPQRDHTGALVGDEDCLALNVWAPARPGLRPVMVFIHGGGFIQGSTDLAVYDGARLARTGDTVVVTLQYRLGPFGFFVNDALLAEDPEAGNQGLRDQILALRWVQENIAAFGGDPARVTIFGESAGGISVCAHLGMPASDGLYARAMIESGTGCYGMQRLRAATPVHVSAITQAQNVLAAAGCAAAPDPLACLRALPAAALVDAGLAGARNGLGLADYGPVIDGVLLREEPFDRVARGERAGIPIVTGANADEGKTFTVGLSIPDVATYESLVRTYFPLQADALLALYPASSFATPKDAYDALLSDVAFICPALAFAQVAAGAGSTQTYTYLFAHTLSGSHASWGAFHALELWFVFGTLDTFPGYTPSAADERVSETLRGAWSAFAWGRPPLPDLPWRPTGAAAPSIAILDDPPAQATEIREGRCEELRLLGLIR